MSKAWKWRAVALFLFALAYADAWQNGFHFDDFHTVVDNPSIRSLSNIPKFFTDTSSFSVLSANQTYRPLVSTSLSLDYALAHGYRPIWFHVTTFAIFIVLLCMLCVLYREAMQAAAGSRTPFTELLALGGAAWFGLHPAMAETINYIIQRGDLYVTTGCVGALVAWIAWPGRRKTGLYLFPFAMGLLSKPPAAVFPLLLMLWIYFFETTGPVLKRWRDSFLRIVPALLLTVGLVVLQVRMTPKTFVSSVSSGYAYCITQPYVWLRYFLTLFFPFHLNVDTDLGAYGHLTAPVLLGFLFLAVLIAAIAYSCRHRRLYPVAYGLLWFLITQLPTSLYPLSEVENDHRMFFSFVGLILAVVWALYLGYERLQQSALPRVLLRVPVILALLLLGGYAWGTYQRNSVWKSEESLWRDDVLKSPRNGRGHMNYGLALMSRGDYQEASRQFAEALAYTPNYPALHVNLGIVNGLLGNQAAAERSFVHAQSLAPGDDSTHSFYARWLMQQGRLEEAAAQARQAVALNPSRVFQRDLLLQALEARGDEASVRIEAAAILKAFPDDAAARTAVQGADSWLNLSLSLFRAGKYAESEDAARKALALRPGYAEAHNNIGAAEAALGNWNAAVKEEEAALRLNPNLKVASNNLQAYQPHLLTAEAQLTENDWINRSLDLNRQGRFEESMAAARDALRLNPLSAEAWNNMAAGYAALHRWEDAIGAAKRALELKPDLQIAKNNLAWSLRQKEQTEPARITGTSR
jgi:protein O-mannosyl-transferase